MLLTPAFRAVAVVTLAVACLATVGGCGGKPKKKGGLTIEQRLERALAEPLSESQSRELVKVARMQARSGDNSGAAKTLSMARTRLRPKPAPKPAPAADASAPPDAKPDAKPDAESKPADAPTDAAANPDATTPLDAVANPDTAAPAEPPVVEPPIEIDPNVVGPILIDIASVYILVGDRLTAKDVLSQVRKLAPAIDDATIKATVLAEAGGIYGAKDGGLGDTATAGRVLAEAAASTDQVEERFRPESLAAVALGYVTAGLAKDASKTVASLEALARTADNRPKAEGLAVAATVRGQTGDSAAARDLLAEANEAARAIESPENRAYALLSIARATVAVADRTAALKVIGAAEKAAAKVGDPEAQKIAQEKVRTLRDEIEKRK